MQKLPDFIIVPYLLMEDKEITLIDERLYGVIYWFGKLKLEKCIASNKTLAELVKTTPATIQNSLTKLENKGFIIRTFKDEARKHRLEIIPLIVFGKVSPTDDTNGLVSPTDDRVSPTDDTVVSLTDDQKKNIYNKKNKEEDFIFLFSLYNKKINPKARFLTLAKNKLKTRLKSFSLKEIEQAINNFSRDKWKMEHLSTKTFAWFLHSDERIESYINLEVDKKEGSWR